MKRILIAEDEATSTNLEQKLQENGFATVIAKDGYEALHLSLRENFDLLILDLLLLGEDGVEMIKELRAQEKKLPILILTAHIEVKDRVAGFDDEAEDYFTKPLNFDELLADFCQQLRSQQVSQGQPEMVLTAGKITLDLHFHTAKVGDMKIHLSNQEFMLLESLMRHPERIVSREELLNDVWGYDYYPGCNIVDVYVGYLRKKLGRGIIETVRCRGYRFGKE
ncbi:MAG: response regulator transcription factor [Prochloraceae cyanobacterium]|nr:response regulator transcription factor [Prochloraceae cyanobacterium]